MKILNLYAGIGGNRKDWGDKHSITAVEIDEKIANIYKDRYPSDTVIIGDAHSYLLEHFREYDFIWSSPPCPTHSRVRKQLAFKNKDGVMVEQNKPVYPDMRLYEEIIFLDNYFDGYYCVENVRPYYTPLIEPQILGRHLFWANFDIPKVKIWHNTKGNFETVTGMTDRIGIDISMYKGVNKRKLLRNCCEGEIGSIILNSVITNKNKEGKTDGKI